jgi:thiol-disulfide isomerase/thioredoxin
MKKIVLVLFAFVLFAAGCEKMAQKNDGIMTDESITKEETAMKQEAQGIAVGEPHPQASTEAGKPPKDSGVLVEDKSQIDGGGRLMAIHDGEYKEYSEENFRGAVERGDKIVLFFYASWCPTCQAADKDFRENIGGSFPKSTTVLRVNYQSGGEMEKKYGVTYQHTFVQVDYDRNQITKWISGKTKELTENLK